MQLIKYALVIILNFTLAVSAFSNEVEKVVIIGAGAAGSSAAIFAAQGGLEPLVVSDSNCNAQIALIHNIDNYPGIVDPIDGFFLLKNFRIQAENFGARFIEDTVESIDVTNRPFKIEFASGETIFSETLIIASGSVKRWLNLSSEQALRGKGVVSATFCKDIDYTDKNVVVIGGGHAALQEAIHISDVAKNITIINRGSKFNASKYHQDVVFDQENIQILYDTDVVEILDMAQEKVTGVLTQNAISLQKEYLPADAVIVSIGSTPNSEIFKDQLELTEAGNIVIKGNNTSTTVSGVFAAGDVTNVSYGRVVIAAGTGAMAALDVIRFLTPKP